MAFDALRVELRQYTITLMQQFDAPQRHARGAATCTRAFGCRPRTCRSSRSRRRWCCCPSPSAAERHPLAPNLSDLSQLTVERLDDLVGSAQRYSPVDDVRTLADEWQRRRHQLAELREGADVTRLRALGGLSTCSAGATSHHR